MSIPDYRDEVTMNDEELSHYLARTVTVLSLAVGASGVGCHAERSAPREETRAQCPPVVFESVGITRAKVGTAKPRPPDLGTLQADTVFQLDSVDLNCDGEMDYVAQIEPAREQASSKRPTLVAFVRERGTLRRVLFAPSPVDGYETVAVAADLSGGGKRDLVTIGSDEGGYVIRVFRWRGDVYVPVWVPIAYRLRQEADWNDECLRKINPHVTARGELVLLRETISPTSTRGHGTTCDLPTDTLHVANDSLAPIH
jgi:hypothetical protein